MLVRAFSYEDCEKKNILIDQSGVISVWKIINNKENILMNQKLTLKIQAIVVMHQLYFTSINKKKLYKRLTLPTMQKKKTKISQSKTSFTFDLYKHI